MLDSTECGKIVEKLPRMGRKLQKNYLGWVENCRKIT
jgi:hypothetical protein